MSLTRANPLTALSSSTTADVANQVEPRIPLGENRRELTSSECRPSTARSYARDQAAALASSSYPEVTLVLVPACRAASLIADHAGRPAKVRTFQEPAYKAGLVARC